MFRAKHSGAMPGQVDCCEQRRSTRMQGIGQEPWVYSMLCDKGLHILVEGNISGGMRDTNLIEKAHSAHQNKRRATVRNSRAMTDCLRSDHLL
ncbi:hypothetical protein ASC66_08140 [Leifsonia sp. Root4]|nr:hypothetical protein ASC66_08140 [Leifsonia sp. Root4]